MQKIKNFLYKKLRLSEKYTRTDMVYIAKGGFWLTFGQSITSILSLILITNVFFQEFLYKPYIKPIIT